ncbi:DEAD/DEAH box helicase family protein [Vibrio jasicida]|uniref:DEAD/DEAH box helicase family protein n=1 Tax=Vibrio jasicida TaxID=766224 RepID=UPI000CE54162|nr:DEAD/DEAH box helicase family protein [Vibrio jasicida]
MLDFGALGGLNTVDTSTVPREIFQALQKTDAKFQYPRDVQGQVWQKWHEQRDMPNSVIKMNTGGGKTAVGLLVLKSCLNEKKGPAVFVVPDNYLLKQVVDEAGKLGIETTTDPKCIRYQSGKSILVANIYKLVNGQSVFGVDDQGVKIEIGSILIDDAHACLDTVERQFTMEISLGTDLYAKFLQIFSDPLKKQNLAKYNEIIAQDPSAFLQVPFWSWQEYQGQVIEALVQHRNDDEIKYSYPLLKSHLSLCHCVFSSGKIEISPHFIPISVIPSLEQAKRKIFMTATLADDSILSTHFGVLPEALSQPITPDSAGDVGDRMILLPQVINPEITDQDIRDICKYVSSLHNVVVIVPSMYRAEQWRGVADLILTSQNIQSDLQRLKNGHVGLTVLVNRYDGIDLPKDACRLLVVDGLPDARSLIDRVKQSVVMSSEYDFVDKLQRVEQGMGRGVRSADDHCVVMLAGKTLARTVYNPSAMNYFSPATKAQMELSEKVASQVQGKPANELIQLMDYCFSQHPQWVQASKGVLASLQYNDNEMIQNIKQYQYEGYLAALRGDTTTAVEKQTEAVNKCTDRVFKGYLKQFLAEYVNLTDPTKAQEILLSANKDNSRLMKPIAGISYNRVNPLTHGQAEQCSRYLNSKFLLKNKMLVFVNSVLEDLRFRPDSANRFEEAMNALGLLLGFHAQRPEAAYNKGPDNIWSIGDNNYLVIECKNEAVNDKISKYYCNQLTGSAQWFNDNYDQSSECTPIMVHVSNTYEFACSPLSTSRVINAEKLEELKKNVQRFFASLATHDEMNNVNAIRDKLTSHKLRAIDIVELYTIPFYVSR